MGWSYTTRLKGISDLEYYRREYERPSDDPVQHKILDIHSTREAVYFALEITGDRQREVKCVIVLHRWVPNAADGYNYGTKSMTDESGPYVHGCPRRILDLLTPTTSETAARWRLNCYMLRDVEEMQKAHRPKVGQAFQLTAPMRFTNGHEVSNFTLVDGKRRLAKGDDGITYRLPVSWMTQVAPKAAAQPTATTTAAQSTLW